MLYSTLLFSTLLYCIDNTRIYYNVLYYAMTTTITTTACRPTVLVGGDDRDPLRAKLAQGRLGDTCIYIYIYIHTYMYVYTHINI